MKKIFLFSVIVATIFACSKKTAPTTTTTDTAPVVVSAEDLAKGKELVATNCVKCHPKPDPKKHSKEEWDNVLEPMMNKAGIVDMMQRQIIHNYIYGSL